MQGSAAVAMALFVAASVPVGLLAAGASAGDLAWERKSFQVKLGPDGASCPVSVELPVGWTLRESGFGGLSYYVMDPAARPQATAKYLDLRALSGKDAFLAQFRVPSTGDGVVSSVVEEAGPLLVKRSLLAPYKGNRDLQTLSIDVTRGSVLVQISVEGLSADLGPRIPVAEHMARSVQIDGQGAPVAPASVPVPPAAVVVAPSDPPTVPPSAGGAPGEAAPAYGAVFASDAEPVDLVGPGEGPGGDGTPDARLAVSLREAGITVVAMALRNVDGVFSVWDTVPGNGMWLLGVGIVEGQGPEARVVSRQGPDGSLLPLTLGSDEVELRLCVHDNGAVAAGATRFELVLTLADGSTRVVPVAAGR